MDERTDGDQERTDPTERQERLPEHESDADVSTTMGGGLMSEGGTAIDRGTGELTGTAQGEDADAGEPDVSPDGPLSYPMSPGDSGRTGIPGATLAADEEREGS